MGEVLAQMHQVSLSRAGIDLAALNNAFYDPHFSAERWKSLIDQALEKQIDKADQFARYLPLIIEVSESAEQALALLKSQQVLTHRDMSPNNVVWENGRLPIIIDWELVGLLHPTVDLIGMAFDWSVIRADEINEDPFLCVNTTLLPKWWPCSLSIRCL